MSLPAHWPESIQYLESQRYHLSVDSVSQRFIRGSPTTCSNRRNRPRSLVVIRHISSPADHPALGQYGLFAARKIPQRTHIVDYLGEVHGDDRPNSNYDLSLYRSADGTVNIGIDAASMGNEARFINDFRGGRERPKAVFEDRRTESGELRMGIWSSQVIKKGEEIVVSYGKSWWRSRTSL